MLTLTNAQEIHSGHYKCVNDSGFGDVLREWNLVIITVQQTLTTQQTLTQPTAVQQTTNVTKKVYSTGLYARTGKRKLRKTVTVSSKGSQIYYKLLTAVMAIAVIASG